jgi:hypothetical protein
VLLPSPRVIVHREGLSASLPHNPGDIAWFVSIKLVGNLEFLEYVLNALSLNRVRAQKLDMRHTH